MGVELVSQPTQRGKRSALLRGIRSGCGDGHEPTQLESWQLRNGLSQSHRFCGMNPRLAGLLADIDLQADLQGREVYRALRRQALREFESIHRMDPVKALCNQSGFIALERADEMPGKRAAMCRQGLDFLQALLDIILAEVLLPERM